MKHKPSGTFWCNHCEDNAFSETCWRCHREATFIPFTAATARPRFGVATAPAPAPASANAKPRFGIRHVTPPADWFRRMREAINT